MIIRSNLGKQRQKHDDGKGDPAQGDQPPGLLRRQRRFAPPPGMEEAAEHRDPAQRATHHHDKKELKNRRGLLFSRVERDCTRVQPLSGTSRIGRARGGIDFAPEGFL